MGKRPQDITRQCDGAGHPGQLLFPARLRCRLWMVMENWNEMKWASCSAHGAAVDSYKRTIESDWAFGIQGLLESCPDPSPWPIGSLAVRPCTRNQFERLETRLFVPENIIVYCILVILGVSPHFGLPIPSFSILLFALSEGPDSQLLTPLQRWTISGYNKTADGKWVCATGYNGTARNRCELGETWLTAKLSVGMPVGSQCWFQALLGWIQRWFWSSGLIMHPIGWSVLHPAPILKDTWTSDCSAAAVPQ